jgi:23S rRNA pseudouridine1911/1915/1917 synthase
MARATVDPATAGSRLDQFVARMGGGSVHAARRLIAEGRVAVDGRAAGAARKGARLATGQVVDVDEGGGAAAPLVPEPDAPLVILYRDADLIAVNKPAGIASHPLRPGETGTLANRLVARFPECAGAGADPREGGLGHRLDRETSGVLLAARGHPTWLGLRAAMKDATCEKTYLAEVTGHPAARGAVTAPIGRSGRRGHRVRVGAGRNPLAAVTAWEVIEVRAATALVRARLHAGRAHQVRAHLAASGHPIVGDSLYGGAAPDAPGLRLHAESVRLRHPTSGAALVVEAPPPDWARPSST